MNPRPPTVVEIVEREATSPRTLTAVAADPLRASPLAKAPREPIYSSGGLHGHCPSCSTGSNPPLFPRPVPGEGAAGPEASGVVMVDRHDGHPRKRPGRATDG